MTGLYAKTTLALDPTWMPMHFLTKRQCFELLVRDKVGALDAHFNAIKTFMQWIEVPNKELFPDLPVIHSATNTYKIPSIVILQNKYIKQHTISSSRKLSRYDLCKIFKYRCQICFEKFPEKQLTIEHVYPQTKGGTHDDFNLTLTCRKCNCEKNDAEAWLNKNGEELKGISFGDYVAMKFHVDKCRKEWEHFFIKKV